MNGRDLFATMVVLLASMPVISQAADGGDHLLQSVAADGPVKMTARIDKATARVAEPIHLVLRVESPRGVHIELPAKADRLGDFEVRQSEATNDIPSATQSDKRDWVLRLTLESIKTGELAIPPLEAHYAAGTDAMTLKTLHTSPIKVQITSVLENRADPTRFRDIKQTVDVPVPAIVSHRWIVWTCAGAAGVAAALVAFVAVVKRRRRGPLPAAWALATLEELEKLDVSQAGVDTLFNEVVDVVREYFEVEFNVPTLRRTTREFLAEASNEVGLPEIVSKRLAWLASAADEIKFARLGVSEQHLQHAFAQAKAFIAECEEHRRATTKGAA